MQEEQTSPQMQANDPWEQRVAGILVGRWPQMRSGGKGTENKDPLGQIMQGPIFFFLTVLFCLRIYIKWYWVFGFLFIEEHSHVAGNRLQKAGFWTLHHTRAQATLWTQLRWKNKCVKRRGSITKAINCKEEKWHVEFGRRASSCPVPF